MSNPIEEVIKTVSDAVRSLFVNLSAATDAELKNELKKRGYSVDISISYTVDGKHNSEFLAIGKKLDNIL